MTSQSSTLYIENLPKVTTQGVHEHTADPQRQGPKQVCSLPPCNPAHTALPLFPNHKPWLLGQIIKGDICLGGRQNRKTQWVRSFCLQAAFLFPNAFLNFLKKFHQPEVLTKKSTDSSLKLQCDLPFINIIFRSSPNIKPVNCKRAKLLAPDLNRPDLSNEDKFKKKLGLDF